MSKNFHNVQMKTLNASGSYASKAVLIQKQSNPHLQAAVSMALLNKKNLADNQGSQVNLRSSQDLQTAASIQSPAKAYLLANSASDDHIRLINQSSAA